MRESYGSKLAIDGKGDRKNKLQVFVVFYEGAYVDYLS
jgi:hypothetical protein